MERRKRTMIAQEQLRSGEEKSSRGFRENRPFPTAPNRLAESRVVVAIHYIVAKKPILPRETIPARPQGADS